MSARSATPALAPRSLVRRAGAFLPHGWRDFWLQFAIFWTYNLAYEFVRGFVDGSRGEAFANARRVMAAQRDLGINREVDVQRWAYDAPGVVMDVANWTYFNCQFTISFAL